MNITRIPTQASPWYTHRWPWFLMMGPAAVMVGGSVVTWLALNHPDAMVVDDYYKQGKAINRDLRRDHVASAMGLALQLQYEGGRLVGRIESKGQPFGAQFTIHFVHPTLPERDLNLLVRPDTRGAFSVSLPVLEQTRWQVVAEGFLRDWRLARKWDRPGQSTLVIEPDHN